MRQVNSSPAGLRLHGVSPHRSPSLSSTAASSSRCSPARLSTPILESTLLYIIHIVALSIKDPEADRLARELAARTGETLTEAVVVALRERLAREAGRTRSIPLCEELATIRRRCADLPVLDTRAGDEVIGYDQHGLPT